MKHFLLIAFLLATTAAFAQSNVLLIDRSKKLHQIMVKVDSSLTDYLDNQLSYGHSNGWIQTREEMVADFQSKLIAYNSITEDSVTAVISENIGYVRFKGSFDVNLQGKQSQFNLKVLEVWRKRKGVWLLFARQAAKIQ